jgi:nucleoid-associated protein YgaU
MVSPRVRRRRSAVVTAMVLLTLAVPAVSRAVSRDHGPVATTYVVRAGDTLWSVAVRHAPGKDPRFVVDAIVRANGIDAAHLVPGQVLQLPT